MPLIRTFTQNLMAYAFGRRVEYYDSPTIRRIASDAAAPAATILGDFVAGHRDERRVPHETSRAPCAAAASRSSR